MRRKSRRSLSRSADPRQFGFEKLEPRQLLACDLRMLSDGTLQIIGDNSAQVVSIVDQGAGRVNVKCQDPGSPLVSRDFFQVAGIQADLRGGHDVLNYTSSQNVNSALPRFEFLMGAGNDRANINVSLTGTPSQSRNFSFVTRGGAGDDTLFSTINSLTRSAVPTRPVVHGEMHGGGGRDEMRLVSNTSSGGFTLTKREQTASVPPTTTDPDCLIWDLIDGSSGQVNAHAMGSEVADVIELRSDARGIGRRSFEFVLDGGRGANSVSAHLSNLGLSQQDLDGSLHLINGTSARTEVKGMVDLLGSSSSAGDGTTEHFFTVEIGEGRVSQTASLDILGSNSRDEIDVQVGENQMDRLDLYIDARGGDDRIRTEVNTLVDSGFSDRPVLHGEMHGGGGRDDMRLISNTSSGGFALTKTEQSASGGTTTTDPDCLIWDLIDGTTGQVNAHVMGSEVAEVIELRTDARGIGRSNFDFVMDGGGGVNSLNTYISKLTGEKQGAVRGTNANEKRLEVRGIIDLVATSSSQQTGHRDDGWWFLNFADTPNSSPTATLEIVGSNSADRIQVDVRANNLDQLAIGIDGRGGNDTVISRMENVINRGQLVQTIETGAGADVVVQSIQGFVNYGTAVFDTRLGAGNDVYMAVASNIYVAPTASFSMLVDGGGGSDLILAAVQATVDGDYQFVARGQQGNDVIGIVQQFSTNWRSGNGNQNQRPTIRVLAEGNDGDDLIGMWLSISGENEDLLDALVDGGLGDDTAFAAGPIRVINVEHHN